MRDPAQAGRPIQRTALLEFVDFGGLRNPIVDLSVWKLSLSEQLTCAQKATLAEGEVATRVRIGCASGDWLPFRTVMTGAGCRRPGCALSDARHRHPEWRTISKSKKISRTFSAACYPRSHRRNQWDCLDGESAVAPIIQAPLSSGGVITGQFTEEEAKPWPATALRRAAHPAAHRKHTKKLAPPSGPGISAAERTGRPSLASSSSWHHADICMLARLRGRSAWSIIFLNIASSSC